MNVALDLFDADQRRAVEAALDAPLLLVTGPAGAGKSRALAGRAVRALRETTAREIVVTRAGGAPQSIERELALLGARTEERRIRSTTLGELAQSIVSELRFFGKLHADLIFVREAEASRVFESAAEKLLSLEWAEILSDELDPEITGLRAPGRFLAAAYRLIRKLREAQIGPDAFLAACRRGATTFYAQPPNFAGTELLLYTPAKYRDSLKVDGAELRRQHRREIDLAKVLARLYEYYVDAIVSAGRLSASDAVVEASALLAAQPGLAADLRKRFGYAFVDDAEDLVASELTLLRVIFGETLANVTLAINPDCALRTLRGARPKAVCGIAAQTIDLTSVRRSAPAINAAAAAILGHSADSVPPSALAGETAVRIYRAATRAMETAFIADTVAATVNAGVRPRDVAVIFRSLSCASDVADALLERNVPIDVCGDASLYSDHTVADALALLWSIVDPFRHDWLLRVLEGPMLRLCDASLAALCSEAPGPQQPLFDDALAARQPRAERSRDVRLAQNVLLGSCDGALEPEMQRRLLAFRSAREHWRRLARDVKPSEVAAIAFSEGRLSPAADGTARTRYRRAMLERLLVELRHFEERDPLGGLEKFLTDVERYNEIDADLLRIEAHDHEAVALLSVEAAADREFDTVFIPQVQAGAFPRYYVPDAFLFSPIHGIIPKENVGEATTARTAKFTWYLYRAKARELYMDEERRHLAVAVTRARRAVYLSSSGRSTRALSAPEFLSELCERPPLGTDDISRSWTAAGAFVPPEL